MALFARCLIYFSAICVTERSPIGDTRVVKPALYGTHSRTHAYILYSSKQAGRLKRVPHKGDLSYGPIFSSPCVNLDADAALKGRLVPNPPV